MKQLRDPYLPHKVIREDRRDGTLLLRSGHDLGPVANTTVEWLNHWADAAPDRVFIAERYGAGWREESYAATLQKVRAIASALLGRGLNADTPILIMSGNGVDHGLLSLAAQYVGVPTVPVAEQYALIHGAHGRLVHAIEMVRPAMAYVADARKYAEALRLDALNGVEIVASDPGDAPVTPLETLLGGDASVDLETAHARIGPDTVAKILMTSGSTSAPKGVLTTQRMMCVNQTQIADALPFLRQRPPRIVDWLPWNHVFGGSHNFNMMLAHGGSLYTDDGKPAKGLFARTVENLSMITGTAAFNVPVGFSMLLGALRGDATLRRRFFEDLDLIFYAGASLSQEVWQGFEAMSAEIKGAVPLMTSSWGLTETAPACIMQHEPCEMAGRIGVPLPGVTVKLIPDDEMRCEVRVKGPNITPGYFRDREKTAANFDDEGFFITGDTVKFMDPDRVDTGLKFDGRISEDFKLSTGTWVRAAQLRLDMLSCLAPLAADLVIAGADRDEIGVMIFPDMAELAAEGFGSDAQDGALSDARLLSEIHRRLAWRAREITGSSTRVGRAIVLVEPPSIAEGEMTAKGNLNVRKVLTRRATLLERLYAGDDPCVTRV